LNKNFDSKGSYRKIASSFRIILPLDPGFFQGEEKVEDLDSGT